MDQKKAILSLNSANYSGTMIAKLVRIPISNVYQILKWHKDERVVKDKSKSGWLQSQQTPRVIKAVHKKICRNPNRLLRLSRKHQVSERTKSVNEPHKQL